ncbi:hypothetical protein FOA52_015120 [Chlamydomonas sp. UWO 241]|nr:hypothetical protein FOA52_015120 [Chlamydomonas sp. UWO 241]
MSGALTIEVASHEDVELARTWAATEGWNPGRHDVVPNMATDPQGFLMGKVDGVPVATISAVRYDAHYAFLGFYIVLPEHRGKGYGIAMWQAAMKQMEGRIVGLDGVPKQQANYVKSGFKLDYAQERWTGVADGTPFELPSHIVQVSGDNFSALLHYDRVFHPASRTAFLKAWTSIPGSLALCAMAPDGQTCVGWGQIRQGEDGHRIGPLFADSPDDADAMLRTLRANLPCDTSYCIDIPQGWAGLGWAGLGWAGAAGQVNQAAQDMRTRHGLTKSFEVGRMWHGGNPKLPTDKIYGVTSLELG